MHEAGHYLAARLMGIRIVSFSIGFGPRLLKYRIGKTLFCVSAIPFGGYVRPYDSRSGASLGIVTRLLNAVAPLDKEEIDLMSSFPKDAPGDAKNASLAAKLFYISNGIIFNLLFAAVVLFASLYKLTPFVTAIPSEIVVSEPSPGSPAYIAGIRAGDRIAEIDGTPVNDLSVLYYKLQAMKGAEATLTVVRLDGSRADVLHLTVVPRKAAHLPSGKEKTNYRIGVSNSAVPFLPSFSDAFFSTVQVIYEDLIDIVTLHTNENAERAQPEGDSSFGTIGSSLAMGFLASHSFQSFLSMLINVNLMVAVLMAVPYPAFDGGQFVIALIEGLSGAEIPMIYKERIAVFGLGSSLILMLITLGIDFKTSLHLLF